MEAETIENNNETFLDEIWNTVNENAPKVAYTDEEINLLLSIAMGGSVAAETLLANCKSVKELYGDGSLNKCRQICLLFSLVMLAQCYRWLNTKKDADASTQLPKEIMATKLMYMHDVAPEGWMEDSEKIDVQFNYDLDKHPHIIHFSGLLIAKCCDILGHQCLDWQKIEFPINEFNEITVPNIAIDMKPLTSQDDINSVGAAISNGITAMNQYIEQTNKKAE